jgi:Raf kinase inhibitor-like YbhB/YbcL family protein
MKLTSTAFGHEGWIPRKYTCQGQDISPELTLEGVPEATKSLVLIVDDPDAPGGTFDHWVAYDIPPESILFEEGATPGTAGGNDFGRTGWAGPCPPSGTHRYIFKVYALDDRLDLPEGLGKDDVEEAMKGRVIEQAELVGLYKKS